MLDLSWDYRYESVSRTTAHVSLRLNYDYEL